MFVINPLDTRPGEAELLAASAAYFADRLFTKRQRQILHITLNITSQPIRVPVARDMLTVQRGLLRNYAPRVFVFSASVAPGMRDAMEVIAHEMIHLSQVLHARLVVTARTVDFGARGMGASSRSVHIARWVGGKSLPFAQVEWHMRPWEIEACRWQSILVDEFLALSTGHSFIPIVQKARRDRLALHAIATGLTPPARVPAVSSLPRLSYVPNDVSSDVPSDVPSDVSPDSPPDSLGLADYEGRESPVMLLPAPHIPVVVPGLGVPRMLHREMITRKHHDLRQRGLVS